MIGAGAIGLSLAATLVYMGFDVYLLSKTSKLDKYPVINAKIKNVTSKLVLKPISYYEEFGNYSSPEKKDTIYFTSIGMCFITTQAFALDQVLSSYLELFGPNTVFVSLCNGKVDDILQKHMERKHSSTIRLGVAYYNSMIEFVEKQDGDNYINVFSKHGIYCPWGPIKDSSGNFKPLTFIEEQIFRELFVHSSQAELLTHESAPKKWQRSACFEFTENIFSLYQSKFISNTIINTLCACYQLTDYSMLKKFVVEKTQLFDQIYDQSYHLAEKLWKDLQCLSHQQLKSKLLSIIENFDDQGQNSIIRHIKYSPITESQFLAGQAMQFDQGFDLLKKLHLQIVNSQKQTS